MTCDLLVSSEFGLELRRVGAVLCRGIVGRETLLQLVQRLGSASVERGLSGDLS
jgi:hypothetical protein